ncbi:MAG: hypothetical protein GY929_01165 [Actinomycetia bacterium]|nr:hypothetical protein [Actinomycetes bacterium]
MTTLYYDPHLDVHHRLPVASSLTTAYYSAPQYPADARRLFDAGCISVGLNHEPELPLRATRAYGSSLVLAREWGLEEIEERLVAAIEASYEPTWNTDHGEFTWGMGLNEPHPRGQYNAFLAAAEAAGPGMWERLSAAPLDSCPQVVDVDFPTMALSRAEWVGETLHVSLAPLVEDPQRTTTFKIIGGEPRMWYLTGLDGVTMDTAGSATIVRVPMVRADLEFGAGSY